MYKVIFSVISVSQILVEDKNLAQILQVLQKVSPEFKWEFTDVDNFNEWCKSTNCLFTQVPTNMLNKWLPIGDVKTFKVKAGMEFRTKDGDGCIAITDSNDKGIFSCEFFTKNYLTNEIEYRQS